MGTPKMSLAAWCRMRKELERLALFDDENSLWSADEIGYSSGRSRPFKCRCPVCGNTWDDYPNNFNKKKRGQWNYIFKRKEITYCPYCKGKRASAQYNLLTENPKLKRYYDYVKNKYPPEHYTPGSHDYIYIKCRKCGWEKEEPVMVKTFVRDLAGYKCPECENGRHTKATPTYNLAVMNPVVAGELAEGRNGGIKAEEILPNSNEYFWFKCPEGHYYRARLCNRTQLGRGCPVCDARKKTSFVEQMFFYYIKKVFRDARSMATVLDGEYAVDILLSGIDVVLECSSEYYHRRLRPERREADLQKLRMLAQYYRVYSIQEYPKEIEHPLIHTLEVPVFQYKNAGIRAQYEYLIYKLLRELFPDRDMYPSIDIRRDTLKILNQYITTPLKKNSLEETHPIIATYWHEENNGKLKTTMFAANEVNYEFWWTCQECRQPFQATIRSRVKAKSPGKCHNCAAHRSHNGKGETLGRCYPQVTPYWHPHLNSCLPNEVSVGSEKTYIFRLADKRCVPVKICNLTWTLGKYPETNIADYLEKVFRKGLVHTSQLVAIENG